VGTDICCESETSQVARPHRRRPLRRAVSGAQVLAARSFPGHSAAGLARWNRGCTKAHPTQPLPSLYGPPLLKAAGISVCLVAVVWIAAVVDRGGDVRATGLDPAWRLTSAGWERADTWPLPPELRRSRRLAGGLPSPLLLALFESLAASLCLLAFPPAGTATTGRGNGIRENSDRITEFSRNPLRRD
jgi:hypothetical protein